MAQATIDSYPEFEQHLKSMLDILFQETEDSAIEQQLRSAMVT